MRKHRKGERIGDKETPLERKKEKERKREREREIEREERLGDAAKNK